MQTLIKRFSWRYVRGKDVLEIRVFLIPEVIHIMLYHKTMRNYIKCEVPIELRKTRRRVHPSFSLYTFENWNPKHGGGENHRDKYLI